MSDWNADTKHTIKKRSVNNAIYDISKLVIKITWTHLYTILFLYTLLCSFIKKLKKGPDNMLYMIDHNNTVVGIGAHKQHMSCVAN
jgi:TM2 domain-containing membrane protein YozV